MAHGFRASSIAPESPLGRVGAGRAASACGVRINSIVPEPLIWGGSGPDGPRRRTGFAPVQLRQARLWGRVGARRAAPAHGFRASEIVPDMMFGRAGVVRAVSAHGFRASSITAKPLLEETDGVGRDAPAHGLRAKPTAPDLHEDRLAPRGQRWRNTEQNRKDGSNFTISFSRFHSVKT